MSKYSGRCRSSWKSVAWSFLVLGLFYYPLFAEQVVLEPVKDNTIYEHEQGSLSNGSGD